MRFISCMVKPVFLMMLASVALVENISAQSLCDTLFIPRGNMFPAERRQLCQADTIILQGIRPENGYEMRWFRNGVELAGQTQEILKVTQAGTYSLRLFRDGCLSADFDTVRIRFRNQPRPKIRLLTLQQAPVLPGSQFTLQLQSVGNSESTVQSWFRNDVLENSSGLTLTGRNTGRYRVRTDSAGCSSFSNEVLVRPAGSFVPQICLSEPLEPNGLKIEWIPPANTSVQQFRVYRKKYYESAFSFVEAVNPGAATWQNDTILYRSAYDVMLTARVNGPGGTYESEPSPINKTIYLQVQPAPAGSTGNVLSWNSYEGFPVNRYYILRNEQLLDSVSGTQNTWLDANPPANAVYRIEAQATENCTSVMSDIDGNVYQTVQIGNQVWMKENLRVSKYRNGDPIPTGLDSASWQFTNSGAYAVYNNASGNNSLYGKLYNWHAVMDARGLCPAGWHAPTDTEWQTLESFLGMPSSELNLTGFNNPRGQAQNVGGKLKAVSNLWTAPNVGATNESGFTALPGGFRRDTGQYVGIASNGYWWTTLGARSRWLAFASAAAFRQNSFANYGFSVRCLKDSSNGLNIETSLIPAGTFTMGSPATEPQRDTNEVEHQVTLSAFRMSKYEISNAQYAGFLNAKGIGSNGIYAGGAYPTQPLIYENSSWGLFWTGTQWQPVSGKENFPVVNVTWYGAAEFATYAGGRLPTEAEWEYACRGGTTTPFSTGACLDNTQANYYWPAPLTGCTNSNTSNPNQTQAVTSYSPNAYGLYNMHGNVWEWCADWYGAYPTTAQTNPSGPASGAIRVLRGGSWFNYAQNCRSAGRSYINPDDFNNIFGFRLAFAP